MRKVALGRSGLGVSRVIFGAMALSAAARDERRRIDTIHAAIDAGMTSIDTAPLYDFGRGEELLGRALAGRREQVQILTKAGLRWDDPRGEVAFRFRDDGGRDQAVRRNSRPDSIRLEVERSLARLRVDALDLVQLHQPDPGTPIADSVGALADLRRAGKLRAIGVSNYSAAQMREAQAALGTIPLASNQVQYSLLERGPEGGLLPSAREAQIGVLAYSPLAQGLLSGAFRIDSLPADDGRRQSPQFHPDNLQRIAAVIEASLSPVARARESTVPQVALAWLLAQPGLTAVVAGASTVEQVRHNAAAAELKLGDDELNAIRAAFAPLRLDPYAGKGLAERARLQARRVIGALWRRLMAKR
jgi:aryl-alcohol dehydrogenase-like predicted oxidoreductase